MSLTEINVEPGFQIQGVENCYMKDDLAYSNQNGEYILKLLTNGYTPSNFYINFLKIQCCKIDSWFIPRLER